MVVQKKPEICIWECQLKVEHPVEDQLCIRLSDAHSLPAALNIYFQNRNDSAGFWGLNIFIPIKQASKKYLNTDFNG